MPEITLRPAAPYDSQRIFQWRNDERTRAFSINTNFISQETHDSWYSNIIAFKPERIFIAEQQNVLVGSIRRDFKDDGIYLSWTVNPEYRGRGIGEAMLYEFIKAHPDNYKALIKENNNASIHIAEKCGFERSGGSGELLLFIRGL